MSFLRLSALPASEGDCLVLSYGASERAARHLLIDGGRAATTQKLLDHVRDRGIERVEALIVTHVDADHIEGVLDFIKVVGDRVEIADVWFNGWKHLREGLQGMGPKQGEELTALLSGRAWNGIAQGTAIRTEDDGGPRELPPLPGGLKVTVLSPDQTKLRAMEKVWQKVCEEAGLVPGDPPPPSQPRAGLQRMGATTIGQLAATKTARDTTKPNGSSIALLVEFDGARVVLGADAHPDILIRSLRTLGGDQPLKVDLFKVPHHGSQANVTSDLLKAIDCGSFLISTDGSRFDHPDEVAIARIIASRPGDAQLYFNYRQEFTDCWETRNEGRDRYTCHFPEREDLPVEVTLLP